MGAALSEVLQHPAIWRGNSVGQVALPSVPTGFPRLDAELPGCGWPRGALTEIAFEREGIGELSLLLPALAALSRGDLWVALIAPPHLPYAPALARAGVDLARVLVVRAAGTEQTLWAAEQALRSGSCAAVLAWPGAVNERGLRKLQLAAEAGKAWGVYFLTASAAPSVSPAVLRLRLAEGGAGPAPDSIRGSATARGCDSAAGKGALLPAEDEALWVHIVKRRGPAAAPFALPLQRHR